MYKEYFGLKEEPFSIAPDPQFLYMSELHREALAHLLYGMKADSGFVLLTGEVGTGKTTVCRCLLNQIPEDSEVAFILNPKLSVVELLATICDELGISYPSGTTSIKIFVDRLNLFLLDAHSRRKRTILIIDEAQNLSIDVLEQIRLLTNLETDKRKLLQVIMLGQPELNRLLERPELRQLAQRVTARYHLEPLSRNELAAYLSYRLAIAGVERPLFPQRTINCLYRLSGGVPRLVNLICDRALLGAYARGRHLIEPKLLKEAAAEIFGKSRKTPPKRRGFLFGLVMGAVVVVLAGAVYFLPESPPAQEQLQVLQPLAPVVAEALESPEPIEQVAAPPLDVPEVIESPFQTIRWPEEAATSTSRDQSIRALLALWGRVLADEDTVADTELFSGLELHEEQGSLEQLRQLDHPAVLTLADSEDGAPFFVTLAALDDTMATLVVAGDLVRVPLATLLNQWSGDFFLLWQPPPGYEQILRIGDQGVAVQWLEFHLAEVTGRVPRDLPGLYFDEVLAAEVRRFQQRQNLLPDGLAGPHTLMLINSRITSDQPRLSNGQG